jgi:spermidine synthase
MSAAIYILFFLSGLSGLIYQVVWVRVFGTVFGSTVYSAALVVAVFMLGLGVGSRAMGAIADRRHQRAPERLLADYGYLELAIGLLGLTIAAGVPHLGPLTARFSTYVTDGNGWHVLSRSSLIVRAAICTLIVAPATVAMGATLTVLIRHVTQHDLRIGAGRVAILYAANTLGAAAGALLTDYALVPWYGLRATQSVAALLNFAAAGAVLVLSMRRQRRRTVYVPDKPQPVPDSSWRTPSIALVSLALVCTGFAAIGMEIIWFRHFTLLLGSVRAVYAMLLAIILLGMGVGSLAGAFIVGGGRKPTAWFVAAQGLFVVATLWGLTRPSTRALSEAAVEVGGRIDIASAAARWWAELWFNARPMIAETFFPAVLMGLTFPLANALVQREVRLVGRRAGWLYLASTAGAVGGSLTAGFVLLPNWGIQASATALSAIAWLSIVPMALADFLGADQKESSSGRMVRALPWRSRPQSARRCWASGCVCPLG